MSQSLVTRCPNCGTSFRVSSAQLSIAQGSVRCGACLHIFSAEEYAENDSQQANTNTTLKAHSNLTKDTAAKGQIVDFRANTPSSDVSESTSKKASTKRNDSDLVFEDNPEEDWDDEQPTDSAFENQSEFDQNIFGVGDSDYLKEVLGEPIDQEEVDESWATEMLAELEKEEAEEQKQQEVNKPSHSKLTTDHPLSSESLTTTENRSLNANQSSLTSSSSQATLSSSPLKASAHLTETQSRSQNATPSPQNSSQSTSAQKGHESDELIFEEFETEKASTQTNSNEFIDSIDATPQQNKPIEEDALTEYRPEIADLDWQNTKSNRSYGFLWPLMAILLIIVLGGQYIYFNFDTLARRDKLRPFLSSVCYVFQCELPIQQDLRQIRSGNLVVRSHPSLEKALIVDVIISNQASFQQPFPKIELAFADLNGIPVASRLFKPDEYLGGELQGAKTMPPKNSNPSIFRSD